MLEHRAHNGTIMRANTRNLTDKVIIYKLSGLSDPHFAADMLEIGMWYGGTVWPTLHTTGQSFPGFDNIQFELEIID